nr:type III-B CRISPR module-associated protein Cmr3 [Chloroflexota bacterium]
AVLSGRLPQQTDCCAAGDLFVFEPRVGLEREAATRTAKEGGLYSPVHVRLRRGVSVVVGVSGLPGDFVPPPLLPFGGESRLARLEPVDPPQMPESSPAPSHVQAVVLLTPARLLDTEGSGWKVPGPGAPASALAAGIAGRIDSLCLPRPVRIGGWDSVLHRPRPLEPYAPAGTVWFLRDAGTTPRSLSIGSRTDFGFGHALIGQLPDSSTS